MLALVLVAASVGFSNLAASIGVAAVGSYGVVKATRRGRKAWIDTPAGQVTDGPLPHRGRQQSIQLLVSGLALSLDNLMAGFALGAYQVSILTGAVG